VAARAQQVAPRMRRIADWGPMLKPIRPRAGGSARNAGSHEKLGRHKALTALATAPRGRRHEFERSCVWG
jgi:hypothetical protein